MDHTKPLSFWEKFGPLPRLLRLKTVLLITGLARSTIYRMIAEHTFPAPVKIGKRAVAWREEDVLQWSEARPSASAP
jgi:prophage regulatory protein